MIEIEDSIFESSNLIKKFSGLFTMKYFTLLSLRWIDGWVL